MQCVNYLYKYNNLKFLSDILIKQELKLYNNKLQLSMYKKKSIICVRPFAIDRN